MFLWIFIVDLNPWGSFFRRKRFFLFLLHDNQRIRVGWILLFTVKEKLIVLKSLERRQVRRLNVRTHLHALVVKRLRVTGWWVLKSGNFLGLKLVELLALGLWDIVLVEFGHFGLEKVWGHAIIGLGLVFLREHFFWNKLLNGLFA